MANFRYMEAAHRFDEGLAALLEDDVAAQKLAEKSEDDFSPHPSDGALRRIAAKKTPIEEVREILAKKQSGTDPSAAGVREVINPPKTAALDAFLSEKEI